MRLRGRRYRSGSASDGDPKDLKVHNSIASILTFLAIYHAWFV